MSAALGAAALFVAALQAQEPPPSVLEMALSERACDRADAGAAAGGRSACVDAQLAALRTDFGANLGRLSPADRRKLDAACAGFSPTLARERYLDCVDGQLASIRERIHRSQGRDAAAPPPVEAPAAVAVPTPQPPPTHSTGVILAFAAGVTLVVAGAGAFLLRKRVATQPVCRACGSPVADHGALCAACRHKAAESVRQQVAARAAEEAAAEARRREADQAAAAPPVHEAVVADIAVAEAAPPSRDEPPPPATVPASPPVQADGEEPAFDPHAVLGVTADATAAAIRAAYEAAKAKYDSANVAHLSAEVQQHYRDKGEAVERAFLMLTGGPTGV